MKNSTIKKTVSSIFYQADDMRFKRISQVEERMKEVVAFSILNIKEPRNSEDSRRYHLFEDFYRMIDESHIEEERVNKIQKILKNEVTPNTRKKLSLRVYLLFILSQWDDLKTNTYVYRVLGDIVEISDEWGFDLSWGTLTLDDITKWGYLSGNPLIIS